MLPLYLIDFPFQIAQLMLISKSKILFDDDYRKEINSKYLLFKNDDFLESLISLYITLFEDYNFSPYNPLIQSLGWKTYFFLREKKTRNIIIKNENYIKYIIKGVSNIVTNNNAERIVLRILTVLQRTIIDNEKEFTEDELKEEEKNRENIINMLKSDQYKKIISSIIKEFCKNLDLKLATYSSNLDTCKHYCIDTDFKGYDVNRYNNALKTSFKSVISIINFYEFIISISEEIFFNIETLEQPLIFTRNFFVFLSTHIIGQPYFGYLEKVLNYIYIKGAHLNELFDSIVNLILNCKNKNKKSFIEFIASTRNILLKPLSDVYKYGIDYLNKKIENENRPYYQYMLKKYEEYKEIMIDLEQNRKDYEKEFLEKIKDIEFLDDDKLCAICLGKIADYEIKPCLHRGCKECLLTYMVENDKCFMCRQPYDSVHMIPKEEIQKLIKDSKKTKTGNEEENNEEENNEENDNKNDNQKNEEKKEEEDGKIGDVDENPNPLIKYY